MRSRDAAFGALALALGPAAIACSTSASSRAVDASPGVLEDAAPRPVDAKAQTDMDAGADASLTPGAPDSDSCPDGGPCDGGVACLSGTVRCAGNGIETCGDSGAWGDAVGCGGSTPFCASGACTATRVPPSCQQGGDGLTNCGAAVESCCTSLEVTGGMFLLEDDPGGRPPAPPDGGTPGPIGLPTTVSSFRLDKYEVTVGRFRQFVSAWSNGSGYAPPAGSGKHTHVNGGLGLVVPFVMPKPGEPPSNGDGGPIYEPGWLAPDDSLVTPTDSNLACDPSYATWTPAAASHETLPINCVNWWEAYAFCVWDGGFLPTGEEWQYAAAGGAEERDYPWGSTDPGSSNQYAICGCHYDPGDAGGCTSWENIAPVGTATMGAGLWGQLDLVGDLSEQVLDLAGGLPDPCVDCAGPLSGSDPRGGAFNSAPMVVSSRVFPATVSTRNYTYGFRCARTP